MHDIQGVMCNAASFRQCASRDTQRHRLDKGIDVRNPAHVQAYVVAREKTPRVRAGRVLAIIASQEVKHKAAGLLVFASVTA